MDYYLANCLLGIISTLKTGGKSGKPCTWAHKDLSTWTVVLETRKVSNALTLPIVVNYVHAFNRYNNYASHKSWSKHQKNGVIIQKESCISVGYMMQLLYADYAKESAVASFRIKINKLSEDWKPKLAVYIIFGSLKQLKIEWKWWILPLFFQFTKTKTLLVRLVPCQITKTIIEEHNYNLN